jgi:hypothetical protein
MALPTDITSGVQTVTATGPVTPTTGLSTAAITGDWTIKTVGSFLSAGKTAKIQIEESTNSFTNSVALAVLFFSGSAQSQAEQQTPYAALRKYALPSNLFGQTSAALRYNVTYLDPAATLSFHGWLEQ